MYYRVAIQVKLLPTWQWKSTPLSSLQALLQFLRLYRAVPHDCLRVFSSSSPEDMEEQLVRENNGLGSPSVTAEQFLRERRIRPPEVRRGAPEHGECKTVEEQEMISSTVTANLTLHERSRETYILSEQSGISELDIRRVELERGTGGDHDDTYTFTLPTSHPQVLVWLKLLMRIQDGVLQP